MENFTSKHFPTEKILISIFQQHKKNWPLCIFESKEKLYSLKDYFYSGLKTYLKKLFISV